MILNIKNGGKKLKKEITINVNGQTAITNKNYTLTILTSGPIFPV